jgi:hypothetical protein
MLDLVLWSLVLALTPLLLLTLRGAWKLIAHLAATIGFHDASPFFEIDPEHPRCSLKHDPLSSSVSLSGPPSRH